MFFSQLLVEKVFLGFKKEKNKQTIATKKSFVGIIHTLLHLLGRDLKHIL